MKYKKVLTALSVFILAFLLFISGAKYMELKQEKYIRELCVAASGNHIKEITNILDRIDEWGIVSADNLKLHQSLDQVTDIINQYSATIAGYAQIPNHLENRKLLLDLSESLRMISTAIEKGIIKNQKQLIKPFLEDGQLSQNEMNYLKTLGDELKDIKKKLYMNETSMYIKDLSYKEMHEIFRPIIEKITK